LEIQKVYVKRNEGTSVIRCPHCGTARTSYVGKFKGEKRRIQVRCSCQEIFGVVFEFRKDNRKECYIAGHYTKLPKGEEWWKMLVTSISSSGVGVMVQSGHNLSKGDHVEVKIRMKDRSRRSIIEKEAVVIWVKDVEIGCEFVGSVGYDLTYLVPLPYEDSE